MRRSLLPAAPLLTALLIGMAAPCASADVKLPALFSDNMVLQQDASVPVWGTAAPNESITIRIADQEKKITAAADGKWQITLDKLPANQPLEMTVAAANTITLKNILVGEVWLCSGQSNMWLPVSSSTNAKEEIAAAKYPELRLFTVARRAADEPQSDCQGQWQLCSPQTISGFSAAAYYFGRDLHKSLKRPVGLIHTSWPGAFVENWTSQSTLAADPSYPIMQTRWTQAASHYPQLLEVYKRDLAAYDHIVETAKAEGKKIPPRPRPPIGADYSDPAAVPFMMDEAVMHGAIPHPASLFNGMLAPLAPYAIRGAVFYQGESNIFHAEEYRRLLPLMVQDWRHHWQAQGGQTGFPFLYVQLPPFGKNIDPAPANNLWPELREAQLQALPKIPNAAMVVTLDTGDGDLHPKDKQPIGHRLSLAAQGLVYGQKVIYTSPQYQSAKIESAAIRVSFTDSGGGLVLVLQPTPAPTTASSTLPAATQPAPSAFAVAGEDKVFVWAEAKLDGNDVLVSSPKVPHPVAVRYAWSSHPLCTLFSKSGLPASPFRTDDWPLLSTGKK